MCALYLRDLANGVAVVPHVRVAVSCPGGKHPAVFAGQRLNSIEQGGWHFYRPLFPILRADPRLGADGDGASYEAHIIPSKGLQLLLTQAVAAATRRKFGHDVLGKAVPYGT